MMPTESNISVTKERYTSASAQIILMYPLKTEIAVVRIKLTNNKNPMTSTKPKLRALSKISFKILDLG